MTARGPERTDGGIAICGHLAGRSRWRGRPAYAARPRRRSGLAGCPAPVRRRPAALRTRDFVPLRGDGDLGQDDTGGGVQRGQQMDLAAVAAAGTPHRFAVAAMTCQYRRRRGSAGRVRVRSQPARIVASRSASRRISSRHIVVVAGTPRTKPRRPRAMSSRSCSQSLIAVTDDAPVITAHTATASNAASGWRSPRGLRGSAPSTAPATTRHVHPRLSDGRACRWGR